MTTILQTRTVGRGGRMSIADPIGAPRRLRADLVRDPGGHVEIHPDKPVEPLDADLRETRVFSGVPEKRSPFNGGTPLPRTRISDEGQWPRWSVPGPPRDGAEGWFLGAGGRGWAGGPVRTPGRLERPSRHL